jgi:hypothetical protein
MSVKTVKEKKIKKIVKFIDEALSKKGRYSIKVRTLYAVRPQSWPEQQFCTVSVQCKVLVRVYIIQALRSQSRRWGRSREEPNHFSRPGAGAGEQCKLWIGF